MLKQLIPVARRKGEIVHMTPIPRTFALPANRAVVMGVVNVTPDSFSDGGRAMNVNDAVNLGCTRTARSGKRSGPPRHQ
jgi:hypothetical protein